MKMKWMKGTLAMMLAAVLVITGCGAKSSPKEATQNAFAKTMEVNSYAFSASVMIEDLLLSGESFGGEEVSSLVSMLKNAKLDITGVAQNEPLQADMKIGVEIPGDMALKFELPMVMTQDKMYLKVPNIPILALPEDLVGKYIEMDMEELAAESGQSLESLDMETSQQFSNELLSVMLGKFDEETYFSDIDAKDAGLPEGIDAKQVVKFAVTKDNFDQAATTLVKDVLPALMDVISKEEYRTYLQIEQSDIDLLKEELQTTDSELQQGLAELKEVLTVNELSVVTAIDKDGYASHQKLLFDAEASDQGDVIKLKLSMTSTMTNINGTQEFSGIPTDIITMEELEEFLMYGY